MIRSALKTSVLRFFPFAVCLHHAAHIPLHIGWQTAGLDEDVVEIKPIRRLAMTSRTGSWW
jgi:hypothetical protein